MGEWMNAYMQKLAAVRQQNLDGGGPEKIEKCRSLGKLSARGRIDLLMDSDTFEEIGSIVIDSSAPYDGNLRPSPSDGVVMGVGKINGRHACVYSFDFTVMSGELANLNRKMQGKRHLQINSNTDCGMSGGPVIDETGHVIGVTVAKVIGLGQSLAILTEHVRDLCAKAGITVELKTPPAK